MTLTYEVEPPNRTVQKAELQKFFKRLRKAIAPRRIKYYACGEYGETFGRPHYHALIFGVGGQDHAHEGGKVLLGPVKAAWSPWPVADWPERGCPGFVYMGTVNYDSARYVADYVQKKLTGPASLSYGPREPPFQLCSQGLGRSFALANRDVLVLGKGCTMRGTNHGMPRYYKKLFAEPGEAEKLDIILDREVWKELSEQGKAELEEYYDARPQSQAEWRVRQLSNLRRETNDERVNEAKRRALAQIEDRLASHDALVWEAVLKGRIQQGRNLRARARIKKKSNL